MNGKIRNKRKMNSLENVEKRLWWRLPSNKLNKKARQNETDLGITTCNFWRVVIPKHPERTFQCGN